MKSIGLFRISLASFIKVNCATWAAMGVVIGVLTLIVSLLGVTVSANMPFIRLTGIVAGIVNIVWVPIVMVLIAVVLSILGYFPFIGLLHFLKGISLNIEEISMTEASKVD